MTGIRLKNIQKSYQVEDRTVPVLNGIDLDIPAGTITVILGQSGCGKTTLLRLTGGLEDAVAECLGQCGVWRKEKQAGSGNDPEADPYSWPFWV